MTRQNRFAELAKRFNEENSDYLASLESPAAKTAASMEKEQDDKSLGTNKENANIRPNTNDSHSDNINDDIIQISDKKEKNIEKKPDYISRFGKREPKYTVRKNFLISEDNAYWLKEVSKICGLSENALINKMIELERSLE